MFSSTLPSPFLKHAKSIPALEPLSYASETLGPLEAFFALPSPLATFGAIASMQSLTRISENMIVPPSGFLLHASHFGLCVAGCS